MPQRWASRIRSLRICSFCSSVKATAHAPWIYDHIYHFSQIVARSEDVVNGVVLLSIMIKSDPAFPSQTAQPRISAISPSAISEQTVSPYLQRCWILPCPNPPALRSSPCCFQNRTEFRPIRRRCLPDTGRQRRLFFVRLSHIGLFQCHGMDHTAFQQLQPQFV